MSSDLSQLDLLVIQIDGLHIGNDLVPVAALGIDGNGGKYPRRRRSAAIASGHECLRKALRAAPDYSDVMFNLALLLQRKAQYQEAAGHWRRYLVNDSHSDWATRARRSLKFCEMQLT
jgi:hypothetical protein